MSTNWTVRFSGTAKRRAGKLPESVKEVVDLLVADLETVGPVQPQWPHYGKLSGHQNCYHCHLLRRRPTYVAVWKKISKNEIEVTYVGSHEGADYERRC